MISGAVGENSRKRSVWWVDPAWEDRPLVPTRWLALVLLLANVVLALPAVAKPGSASWLRGEAMASDLFFGAALVFLVFAARPGASGFLRVSWLAALGTSVASVLSHLTRTAEQLIHPGSAPAQRDWARFAIWCAVSAFAAFALDVFDRRRAASELRDRQLREAKDAALRARLAPHFVFNALGTLQAQIDRDPAAASATADALARLFRQALAAAGRPLVPLREELEFVEAYLGIERARLGNRLRVKLDVPEELEEVEIPPLSLQALVENAVRHGIAPREDGGEIRVAVRRTGAGENPGIVVSVENPVAASSTPGTGTGLAALRGRLKLPGDLTAGRVGDAFRAEFFWGTK